MTFVVDESVDRQIVDCLRADGYEVFYIAEMKPGISDDEVLSLANRKGSLLVTADKDFGELVFRQHRISAGVLLIRLAGLLPAEKAKMVASAIGSHKTSLPNAFTVITPGVIRIRPKIQ